MPLDLAPHPTADVVLPLPTCWTAERFLAALHPPSAHGRVSVMMADADRMYTRTYRPCELDAVAGVLAERESYVTQNRSHGPRGRSNIAAINAVWLDLDTYRVSALAHRARRDVEAIIRGRIADTGLPAPSFLIDSGRGYYVIWLIRGAAAALPRWSALMRALVEWAKPLGADPACIDAARVLRVPGSWHEGAGREVTVVDGTAERHCFEEFSSAVWRATGRPTRRELDERKMRRALRVKRPVSAVARAHRKGLSRRAFWAIALDDLERLRENWGGSVPTGLRDIWLHLWVTALGWTAVETDLAECVVAKAGLVAPGLSVREVRRMMSTTVRRAEQVASGRRGPNGRDPRYDYGGGRMAELLGVDRVLAAAIGLRQIVPADLRADRKLTRRTAHRRASGISPRAIWLAAHPIERERPWEVERISRATWYRRLKKTQEQRSRAHLFGLLAGAASAPVDLFETGPVSLYRGVAQPSASPRRPGASRTTNLPENPPTLPKTLAALMLTTENAPKCAQTAGLISPLLEPNLFPAEPSYNPTNLEHPRMPFVDPDILALASRRLTAPDLGNLTRIALALGEGPTDRHALGWKLKLEYDELEKVGDWLRIAADGRTVLGLAEPSRAQAGSKRAPRQGALFADAAFVPFQSASRHRPSSIKAAVINEAIRIMVPAGVSEARARSFLGGLFRDHGVGLVAEVVHELSRTDGVPDPVAWVKGFLRRRKVPNASYGGTAPSRRDDPPAAPAGKVARPLATPEFLGISPGRAEKIRANNRKLQLMMMPRDGD